MEDFFEPILSYTLLEMAEWNKSDVETEEIKFGCLDEDEIVFE